MKAVIFAAGKSTRTYPLTLTRPKPLLAVANKPILAHQFDALRGIVDGVVLVVGYRHEMIRERFGAAYLGLPIEYIEQKEQKGTGHALQQCEHALRESFLTLNGDDLYDRGDLAALAAIDQGGLARTVEDPRQFGVYEVDAHMNAVRIVEKPKNPPSKLANIGAYKFSPDVFECLRDVKLSERGEIEITSAMQMLADRKAFRVVESKGYWLPIGYPWDLLGATQYVLDNLMKPEIHRDAGVSPAAHLTGAITIGRGTVIRPGVVIDGPVIIGENCTIGPNAWIRPHSAIGNGCKIGQASEIKGSILMDGAAVPHLSYAGDSILGEKVNFGCGTITANFRHDGKNHKSMVKGELVDTGRRKLGAIVGDNVHTGINTSIYPGRKLWPNVGTLPGEVVQRDKES